jgi:hypothetical protein
MKRIPNQKLFLFASLFLVTILLDLLKYVTFGKPTIVNWDPIWPSIVHPLWVLTAVALMYGSVFFKRVQTVAFCIYLVIFVASLANVYLNFTTILSYWCMIFNLVLVSVFFFAERPVTSHE